ncbi:Gelsolin domain-containing protein [Cynara cardunculus var. scolymus]|uniref:Gelsolin domain-containing protein n=1 Tax=Cynara cardunculus var. scolymus TaxID=59895 RepID=A0A103YNM5_CYNCS|nr:Gelsolin domain-containing protein [Cynara cardunculus var. scolymus]
MGTENPNHANNYPRPSAPPFARQSNTLFSSSRSVVASQAAPFRPTSVPAPLSSVPAPPSTAPSLPFGTVVGSAVPGFRPMQTGRPTAPYGPPTTGPFQRFPTAPYLSTPQAPPPHTSPVGQPVLPPTMRPPPPSQVSPMPTFQNRQPHIQPMPMGSPPPSMNGVLSSNNAPQLVNSQYFSSSSNMQRPQPPMGPSHPDAVRASSSSAWPGYPGIQSSTATPAAPVSHQGGYAPPPPTTSAPFSSQGGYGPAPPVASPLGMYVGGSTPPTGVMPGLVEDFSSLSIGSVPGSFDAGLDTKVLPRPLDGDVEPSSFTQMYPMNCNSRYLRLTTSAIPNSQSLVSRWHLPLGAVVCPLAEAPEGNYDVDCLQLEVTVQNDYFAHLDASGKRVDLDQRPELTNGCVEFVAPAEYMVRPPMPPLYFFLIDVSIYSIQSGMLESSLTQPQMMVVSDLDDIFIPLPDDLLVNLSESRTVVDAFLDSLPSMFQDNVNVESAFGPALKAAFMVMSQLGGKLLIFQSTLPSLGVGTLAKYTGGQVYYYPSFHSAIHKDKLRHELARDLTRETAWEAVMRIRCGKGVRFTSYHGNFMLRSTDLLALPAVDCDKAYAMQFALEETLLTTQIVYFQVALLYPSLILSSQIFLFNSVFEVCLIYYPIRCFFNIHTSSSGERRIRVHTAAASVVADLGEMYRQADTGAVVSLLGRLGFQLYAAIEKSLSYKLEEARNAIQLRIVKALKEYRNLYAVQHRVGTRMIYPESLKYLPLYGLALCKSTALRGGYADSQLDERCAAGFTMMALPVKKMLKLLYPSLLRVDEYLVKSSTQADEFEKLCKRLPLAAESLDSRGIFVYDDGFRLVVWFGQMLSPDISRNLVGEDFATDFSRVSLVERENEMSRKLMAILMKLRGADASYYPLCHLVRQGEQPREGDTIGLIFLHCWYQIQMLVL